MPGTITFKPLAASLNINKKADPYCSFKLGDKTAEGKPSGMGGKNPHWEDSISFEVQDQARCLVELKDQKNATPKGYIGNFEIDVHEIEANGKLRKWFTVLNNDQQAGEILVEASYIDKNPPKEISRELRETPFPQREVLQQPKEFSFQQPREILRAQLFEKEPQTIEEVANVAGPDLETVRSPWDTYKRSMEGANSIAKSAETNEFGDYQPEKQLPWGDQKHEYGTGWIQQGNYYSGQQTSYGEAYPMAQKSVAFDRVPTIEEYGQTVIPRGTNPTDYARWWHQAFVPKKDAPLEDNISVVEQAYKSAKRDDLFKKGAAIPTARLAKTVGYSANEGAYPNVYATERSLDEKGAEFETSPISGRTFGSETDTSRNESLGDIIAREQDISKGVNQPTPHGIPGDPDSDHSAFRDIKNTKREY